MTRDNDALAKMFKTQQSLTEWLDDIDHDISEQLRKEDNDKRERLKIINRITGLPFDEPMQFTAGELAKPSEKFKKYLEENGQQPCALRLIPIIEDLPKLRMRGLSVEGAFEWFKELNINPDDYRADFVPHETCTWSTIFVVNKRGVFGEIIKGGHHQLTQGFHETGRPITFQYDFSEWHLSRQNSVALEELKKIISLVTVVEPVRRAALKEQLGASFAGNILIGYFETTDSDDFGVWFKDYNQTLSEMYVDTQMKLMDENSTLAGQVGSPGVAVGEVQIVHPQEVASVDFREGSILVCEVTTPDYVPIMRKAAGIITDQGGILSHAAIVARELGVPCIVGTVTATADLQEGQLITVDADKGEIRLG